MSATLPTRFFRGTTLAIAAALAVISAPLGEAQAETGETLQIEIDAQPLEEALVEVGRRFGVVVVVSERAATGKTAPAVSGRLSAQQAIERLLEGARLEVERSADGVFVVSEIAAAKASSGERGDAIAKRGSSIEEIVVRGTSPRRYRVSSAVTATGVEAAILDTPRSIQVIPEQVILDQQAQDLRDVLRNASGVQSRNISGGTTDAFVLRGFEVQNVLQDGFQIDRNTQRVRTGNIERVEVVKGPNAILFGQSQPGGVINVITKRPQDQMRLLNTTTIDRFGRRENLLDVTGPLDADRTLLYRVVAAFGDSDTFRRADDDAEIKRRTIAPSLTWRPNPSHALTLGVEYSSSELPFDEGTVAIPDANGNLFIPGVSRRARFGEDSDVNDTEQTIARLSYEYSSPSGWFVNVDLNYQESDVESFSHAPGPVMPDGSLRRQQQQFEPEIDRFFAGVKVGGDFDLLGVEHKIVVGADFNDRDFSTKGFAGALDTINIFDPVYEQTAKSLTQNISNDTDDRQTAYYAQDVIRLSERFILSLGARVDLFEREGLVVFNGNPRDPGLERKSELSPNLGIVFKVTNQISAFASYSESFDPNNSSLNRQTGAVVTVDPSEGRQMEVGVKGSFLEDRVSLNLAYYDIERTDIPFGSDPDTGVTLLNGEERSRGGEIDATVQFAEGLTLIANYAHTHAEVTEGAQKGNDARNVPERTGNLSLTYEFTDGPLAGLGLGGGLSYVGRRFVDAGNTFELESYKTFDFTAFYYLPISNRSQVRLQIGLRNAFDEEYYTPNSNVRTLGVGQPRTLFLSLGYEFAAD